jgi:hypothetical protein
LPADSRIGYRIRQAEIANLPVAHVSSPHLLEDAIRIVQELLEVSLTPVQKLMIPTKIGIKNKKAAGMGCY